MFATLSRLIVNVFVGGSGELSTLFLITPCIEPRISFCGFKNKNDKSHFQFGLSPAATRLYRYNLVKLDLDSVFYVKAPIPNFYKKG